jgi:hypothetical protein
MNKTVEEITQTKRRIGRPRLDEPSPDALPVAVVDAGESPDLSGVGPETFLWFPNADKRRQPFVRLYRVDEHRRAIFHGILSPDDGTDLALSTLFGGGKYSVQLIETIDSGEKVIKGNRTILLPGKYIPPTGDLPGIRAHAQQEVGRLMSGAPPTAPAAATVNPSGPRQQDSAPSPREAIDMAFATKMLELLQPATKLANGTSIVEHLPAILVAIAPVFVEMFRAKAAPVDAGAGDRVLQALERISAQLASTPAPQAPTPISGAMQAMEELTKFTHLFKAMKGGGVPGDDDEEERPKPNVGFDQQLLSVGAEVLKGLMQNKNPQAGATATPVAAPSPMSGPPMNPVEQLVAHYAPQLVDAAQRGLDPGLVAGMANSYCPPQAVGALQELMARDDLATYLPQLIPVMKNYPKWVAGFVDELRSFRAEEIDEEPEEGSPEEGG